MAEYRITAIKFWPKEISRIPDAYGRYIASYLRICPHTNMIGAYYLPLPLVAHETLLDMKIVEDAMDLLGRYEYAYYDKRTEQVYIPSLARDNAGKSLKPGDRKVKSAQRHYDDLTLSFICDLFWNDYGSTYGLRKRADAGSVSSPEQPKEDQKIPAPNNNPASPPPPPPRRQDDPESEILALLERYTPEEQVALQQVFELLKLTRKSGKIADSILLTELRRWNTLDVRRVMYGVTRYIDRGYHNEDKREPYLWTIMRRVSEKELARPTGSAPPNGDRPHVSPVTQHNMQVIRNVMESL